MAEKTEVVDGKLRRTITPAETVEMLERDEVIGKRAEAQTEVDHAQLDLDTKKAVVDKYNKYLADIDKQKVI